jgi:hypothetical protein
VIFTDHRTSSRSSRGPISVRRKAATSSRRSGMALAGLRYARGDTHAARLAAPEGSGSRYPAQSKAPCAAQRYQAGCCAWCRAGAHSGRYRSAGFRCPDLHGRRRSALASTRLFGFVVWMAPKTGERWTDGAGEPSTEGRASSAFSRPWGQAGTLKQLRSSKPNSQSGLSRGSVLNSAEALRGSPVASPQRPLCGGHIWPLCAGWHGRLVGAVCLRVPRVQQYAKGLGGGIVTMLFVALGLV